MEITPLMLRYPNCFYIATFASQSAVKPVVNLVMARLEVAAQIYKHCNCCCHVFWRTLTHTHIRTYTTSEETFHKNRPLAVSNSHKPLQKRQLWFSIHVHLAAIVWVYSIDCKNVWRRASVCYLLYCNLS